MEPSYKADEKILDYLDGTLTPSEHAKFEEALRLDHELRKSVESLRLMENDFRQTILEQPSAHFTQQIMSGLSSSTKFSMRNGIILVISILMITGIALLLQSMGVFDTKTTVDLNQFGAPQQYIGNELPSSWTFTGKLLVNSIIVVNIILALLILDRTVLKPFFQSRMQEQH